MRAFSIAVLLTSMIGCAADDRMVPILHMQSNSESLARQSASALEQEGFRVELVPVSELPREKIPDWVGEERDGWLLMGLESKKNDLKSAFSVWLDRQKKRSPASRERTQPLVLGDRRSVSEEEVAP